MKVAIQITVRLFDTYGASLLLLPRMKTDYGGGMQKTSQLDTYDISLDVL